MVACLLYSVDFYIRINNINAAWIKWTGFFIQKIANHSPAAFTLIYLNIKVIASLIIS